MNKFVPKTFRLPTIFNEKNVISMILLIINGLYNLAIIIYKRKYFSFLSNYAVSGQVIVFFLVVNFLSIFLYIVFILLGVNKIALQAVVIILILIGFYKSSLLSDIL